MLKSSGRILGGSHELDLTDLSKIVLNSEEQRKDDPERRGVKQMWEREINTSLLEVPHTCVIYTDVLLSFCGVYGRE